MSGPTQQAHDATLEAMSRAGYEIPVGMPLGSNLLFEFSGFPYVLEWVGAKDVLEYTPGLQPGQGRPFTALVVRSGFKEETAPVVDTWTPGTICVGGWTFHCVRLASVTSSGSGSQPCVLRARFVAGAVEVPDEREIT